MLNVIAGNCVIENEKTSIVTALFLKEMSVKYSFKLTYKSSFKKDNRSSIEFFSGLKIQESINIFKKIKKEINCEILTDFHNLYELEGEIIDLIDIIQIPAYLCMQTELTLKIAKQKKKINIKKGQFLHPEDVKNIIKKIESTGNKDITITERGTCFGYRDLVVDPRSFVILKSFGYPVIFDAGHSVRKYGVPSSNLRDGGAKIFINALCKTAIVNNVDGIFVEVHPNPNKALCDAATQLSFDEFENLIKNLIPFWKYFNEH
jgi:2-dehydro-3-deoxyphosphooctonate aldolase (KDO 8-P synthase)